MCGMWRIRISGLCLLVGVLVGSRGLGQAVEPPKVITNTIGMKLVLIPAGEFVMGSPDSDKDAQEDEKPQHRVRITRPFYLGATEVTQGQYRAVTGQSPSFFKGSDDLPVEQVSWSDAVAFCNRLNERERGSLGGAMYRLPTEAEWEYACRAGSTTRYSSGDDPASLSEFAWYHGNSDGKTHPVGQKRQNAFHLFDMHGNVWEWCSDGYGPDYYKGSSPSDPTGASHDSVRMMRGGSWSFIPQGGCRSANRFGLATGERDVSEGFRVARVQSGQ
jgi:formylglycine-generating enzyme required for sulfatase activity